MPQVIGLTATVLGDMSSRPNWGLNELDFVFATLVSWACGAAAAAGRPAWEALPAGRLPAKRARTL